MCDSSTSTALRTAARIAFRHIAEVGETEREQVLVALIEVLPEADAAIAEQMLFHFREQRRFQLKLALILDGKQTAHGDGVGI